jgi:glycosyltransferase involved in cell wall biosynthesis
MPETGALVFDALRRCGRPIVLSPIYWDTYAYWFETAAALPKWQWLARIAGTETARAVYVGWQRAKRRGTEVWRTQQRLLCQAARLLPNSASEAALLGDTFALPPEHRGKCDVVPNGIDPSLFEATTRGPSFADVHGVRDFVLQVGTISPVKNQLGLIEALFDVQIPLVFVGHTPLAMASYARRCRERAAERGRVLLIDHLPAEALPGVYGDAAVHVLPSWRETPGLVSLEAAACGCRIVSTSLGSAREYFGEHAWYCHPADRQSIRHAVQAALEAPKPATLRRHVLSNFTWRRAAEATVAAYERAVAAA